MNLGAWNFRNPVEIHFGLSLPKDLALHLERVPTLFVTSPGSTRRGLTQKVTAALQSLEIEHQVFDGTTSNPSFLDIAAALKALGSFRPQQVLGIGGGSALDLAKVLSYVYATGAPSFAELSVTLKANKTPPDIAPLPFFAVPTTSGTGSEVTPFATVWDSETKKKHSLASPRLFPKKALLDPTLTESLPWDVTLSTGLDALAQALESVWNRNYNPLTGAIASRAVSLALEALPKLKHAPAPESRARMAEASLLAGLCISRTRTALSHSISYPVTAHFDTPHGIACAFTLPELWAFNFASDDGRMQALLNDLGETGAFDKRLGTFLNDLGFAEEFRRTVKSGAAVLALASEMHTPGRADNNLRNCGSDELAGLVQRSLQRWL